MYMYMYMNMDMYVVFLVFGFVVWFESVSTVLSGEDPAEPHPTIHDNDTRNLWRLTTAARAWRRNAASIESNRNLFVVGKKNEHKR